MKTLNEDIKTGNFKPVYLLYGEEAYLKKQYRDRITKAIFPDGDTVNYAYYEGKGINPGELIDLAETMPFFADRRLIVIENSGFFKNASPELADYIKTMPDTACFLFVENEADKRGKMYKAVKSKGRVVEMARQDEKTLLYWVAGNVKKEGYKIKEQTARYLLSTTGTDMENLEKELEKLFCYCMGKEEIEVRDIEAICTTQITNKIFEMVEAVAVRNQKKALDYYYDLLALKEPPMRILYLLTRQFKLLLEVKDLAGKRYDKAAIAKTVGLHPFVAGKYMQQCRTFEKKELRSILEDAVDTEELVKTGYLSAKQDKKKRRNAKPVQGKPFHYRTSDGFDVFAGKNNIQNDLLTLKTAFKRDMWFHTQKIHGSHVILVCDGREPTDEAMTEAAEIAAWHSQARGSSQVPVDYSQVRNIKKPNGAKPGMVIYHTHQTAYVTPDEKKIEKLRVE